MIVILGTNDDMVSLETKDTIFVVFMPEDTDV